MLKKILASIWHSDLFWVFVGAVLAGIAIQHFFKVY